MAISMKEVNKKYRCISEFDDNGELIKSDWDSNGKPKLDPDCAMIYCMSGHGCINKFSNDTFIAYIYSAGKYNNTIKVLKKAKVKIFDDWGLDGEGVFKFNEKDLDVVCRIMKAKKQRATPVGLHNIKDNRNYYYRMARNFCEKYK